MDCCGLLSRRVYNPNPTDHLIAHPSHTGSNATQEIPYYNILDASLSELELNIIHALPTSRSAVRPSYITYQVSDKTSLTAARSWVETLLDQAYGYSQRNKRIKVLVNPFGGQGTAAKLYAREAEPILKAAKCEVDVQQTTHSGHAIEIAKELDIDSYDVVACCSGDGLPHEVFNGLANQPRPRRALQKIAVAQIPCGSGNAMSMNLNGTNSASMAALAIVKGVRTPLDLVAITQGQRRYLSFLSQSVGIVAESDLGTENIRWMGSARFTVGFLVRLLGKTVYPAEVAVKVEGANKQQVRDAYRRMRAETEALAVKRQNDKTQEDDPSYELPDDMPQLRFGSVHDDLPSDWRVKDMPTLGNFYCGNMTWMSGDAPFFPAALPNDNAMDLVDIDGRIPRTQSIKLLLSIEKNNFFDQPTVNYRKVTGYRITPRLREGQKEGYISVDGEKMPFEPFQAEVVGGLGTVLSKRGTIYEFEGPKELEP